jgi:hypothetical protein
MNILLSFRYRPYKQKKCTPLMSHSYESRTSLLCYIIKSLTGQDSPFLMDVVNVLTTTLYVVGAKELR